MEQLIVFAVVGLAMYFIVIAPQQRRQKEARAMLASLEEGDEIVIGAGIHGFISAIDGDVLWVEVADGVDLKVSRNAVVNKIVDVTPLDGADDESDESEHSADPLDDNKPGDN